MSNHVFHLHSTLEVPMESVTEYFEGDPEFPDGIADIEITRRNNTLIVSAVAADDSVGKYTPTAQLKATVTETRVYTEEEQELLQQQRTNPSWNDDEEEEEPTGRLIEIAAFKGDREAVLQNSALRYEMFLVLCELAERGEGKLTAITAQGDDLQATQIIDGEPRPATVEVVEDPSGRPRASSGVDWRSNQYIS